MSEPFSFYVPPEACKPSRAIQLRCATRLEAPPAAASAGRRDVSVPVALTVVLHTLRTLGHSRQDSARRIRRAARELGFGKITADCGRILIRAASY